MNQIFRFTLLLILFNSCALKSSKYKAQLEREKLETTAKPVDADFVIAFGSCNKQDLPQPLWNPILANDPDVFIWGGDNIYADTEDMEKLEADYNTQLANEGYKKLLAKTEVLATWDDHDYGENDGGASWKYKRESQQKFLDFLNVPENDKRRERAGVFHSMVYKVGEKSVKVILLDTRFFRSELKKSNIPGQRYDPSPEGTVLGEQQWEWLEKELKNSNSTFNILVSSIQFLAAEHGFETWGNFPKEIDRLKELIVATKAENIVLLSGDRHISEFSRIEIPGLKYPLIDFTSSGLTHTYSDFTGEPNKLRTGKVISDLSFGLLIFDLAGNKVKMQMRGEGNVLQQELVEVYK
jgi:alkaline phosphatase D